LLRVPSRCWIMTHFPGKVGTSSKNVAPCQKTREPNVEEIRAARVREGMRLDALEKQRSAMRRWRVPIEHVDENALRLGADTNI
jgi:hypothetical protein